MGKWEDLVWLTPHILLIVITLASIGLGTFRHLTTGVMSLDVLLVISFWAILNVSFAVAVVRDAVRCANLTEENHLFPVPLPIELSLAGGPAISTSAQALNRKKMLLNAAEIYTQQGPSPVSGRIFLPEGIISFNGQLFGNTVEFTWHDIAMADRLDLNLHNCGWQRLFLGYRMKVKTPSQWLRTMIGIASDEETHLSGGKFILFKDAEDTTNNWRLGGCSPSVKLSEHTYLMVWGTDHVPPVIVIKDPESDAEERGCNVVAKSSFIHGMNCRVINLFVLPVLDRRHDVTGKPTAATYSPNAIP